MHWAKSFTPRKSTDNGQSPPHLHADGKDHPKWNTSSKASNGEQQDALSQLLRWHPWEAGHYGWGSYLGSADGEDNHGDDNEDEEGGVRMRIRMMMMLMLMLVMMDILFRIFSLHIFPWHQASPSHKAWTRQVSECPQSSSLLIKQLERQVMTSALRASKQWKQIQNLQ